MHSEEQYYKRAEGVLNLSRNQLQNHVKGLLYSSVKKACENSPFYRNRTATGVVKPEINSLEEFYDFEYTTKQHLRQEYPLGLLATPISNVARYGESTGSTGSPTSAFMTYDEWKLGAVWVERSIELFFTPNDIVFVAIPYELSFASYDLDRGLEKAGVTVVPVGTLNKICPWDRIIEMMRSVHPTGIVCTPTRALRLYDLFLEKGYDPKEVGLRKLLYVGETCSKAKIDKIAKQWGVSVCTAYGSTETNSLALPCKHNKLHLAEDRYFFEVIDPRTGKHVASSERGELVLSSLFAEAMPLIRYRTGDIVRINEEQCYCGMPQRTVEHFGRYDEKLTINNQEIYRIDIEQDILSVPGTGCYYVVATDPAFEIWVEIVIEDHRDVLENVKTAIHQKYGVLPQVQEIDKEIVLRVMDTMTKPGSISPKHIKNYKE